MNFELEIIHWLQSLRSTLLDFFFETSTMLGEEVVLICVLGFVYWCLDKTMGEKIGLTVFISIGINSVLKVLFMRVRPYLVDDTIINLRETTSPGYSFPSGHTQTASTLFFSLFYFLKKKWLLIVAVIVTVLVAISRMYIGVHYLTDVLAGALLGIGISYFMSKYLDKPRKLNLIYKLIFIVTNVALVVIFTTNYYSSVNSGIIDSVSYYDSTESLAKMFGTISGFILAIGYEKKYVKFTNHKNILKNIIRFAIGLGLILLARFVLKAMFNIIIDADLLVDGEGFKAILALILDYLRYTIMLFIGIGLYPILFKKFNF